MSIIAIGINHRSAPLELLERCAVGPTDLPKVVDAAFDGPHVTEAVVLATCNRVELYAVADRFHGAFRDLRELLADLAHADPDELQGHLFVHYDEAAVHHVFRVAAGLDSAVLGEHEIQGQLRTAWQVARDQGSSGSLLNLLFRHALETGKRARTETGIARSSASVSSAAVDMARRHLGRLDGARVLVLGAGEMGEGMVVALAGAGVSELAVANRTPRRAHELADRVGGRAIDLDLLADELDRVDLLLTGTGATSLLVEHSAIEAVMQRRRGRPLLIVDVAVPRDVDPGVAALEGVTLLDMDDLAAFAAEGIEERSRELEAVERIIDAECVRFAGERAARAVAPLVTALYERAEGIRQSELERVQARLADLDTREQLAVEALTKGIVAKLLHTPAVRVKEQAGTPRGERLAEALTALFDLR